MHTRSTTMTDIDSTAGNLSSKPALLDGLLRAQVLARLQNLRGGHFSLVDSGGTQLLGDPASPHCGSMHVHSPAFYARTAFGGSVGAAESYMDGEWQCEQLVEVMRLMIRNRDLLDGMEGGNAAIKGWLMKAAHALRRNTQGGSRRNIAAHYDLGNDLFELFLDPGLMYSSAIFESADDTLEHASMRKLAVICETLQLGPDDHLLEIGTGWGGMAIHAAKHTGCKVTTTTISRQQHELAARRIQAEGLQDRITLLLQDYRELGGRFEKLVSIEMIEAIGHQYQDTYFAKCSDLLKPGGKALVQAITIEDHRYRSALGSVDFIKRHIFPGSYIPCVSSMVDSAARARLRLLGLRDIGGSYARTLHEWRRRFLARHDAVRALGYDARFCRMWDFYLAYCEAGFLEESISDVQLLFAKGRLA